jgi:hypothetical protein
MPVRKQVAQDPPQSFAEADIISHEKIHPRHPQGADHGVQLVFLDLDVQRGSDTFEASGWAAQSNGASKIFSSTVYLDTPLSMSMMKARSDIRLSRRTCCIVALANSKVFQSAIFHSLPS